MIKKLTDKVHEFIGGWAWFVGSCMADAFIERMDEIDAEHQAEMNAEEQEVIGLMDKSMLKKSDPGAN